MARGKRIKRRSEHIVMERAGDVLKAGTLGTIWVGNDLGWERFGLGTIWVDMFCTCLGVGSQTSRRTSASKHIH
eukprot:5234031-Amphidinium_carterae.2